MSRKIYKKTRVYPTTQTRAHEYLNRKFVSNHFALRVRNENMTQNGVNYKKNQVLNFWKIFFERIKLLNEKQFFLTSKKFVRNHPRKL